MIDPQEILSTYNTLISGQSTKAIKQAEQRLKQLCDIPAFLEINKAILISDQLSLSIKKMSAVHLSIFLKKNKRNNNVAVEVIAQSYLELLCHEKMDYSLKALLMPQLQELLSDDANQPIRTALMSKLLQDLSKNAVNYQEVVYIGHALLGLKATPKNTKNFIMSTFEQYNLLACQLHAEVSKVTDKQTLINLLRIITEYSKLIQLFIARIGLMDVETSKLFYSPQLAQSVRTAFQLTIPGNQFSFHLFFSIPQQQEITSLLNTIKKNYISILGAFLRILKGITKNPENLATNLLYMQSSLIIDYCIQATADMLQNRMYYQLVKKSQLVPSLFQSLGLMITALRNNDFYETFRKYRTELLQKVLIHCLCFSPGDVEQFYQNHTQFVQKVLQIVDKEANTHSKHIKRKSKDDEQVQMFDTLKTYAGDCISVLCKYQDEVLAEIFEFAMNVLEGNVGCPYPKSVFLLLITLLKPRLTKRKDFEARLGLFLVSVLKETQPPLVSEDNRKEQDLEYALLLLAVSRFAPDFGDLNVEILPISFQRGMSILSGEGNEIYKTLIFELFDEVNRLENGQEYALNLLQLYNSLILKEPSNRLLDSYYQLLQFNLEYFQAYSSIVMEGICTICKHVEQQLKKPHPTQLFLNKCCNVVREIGQSQLYLPKVIPDLEKALLPWLSYIDGREGIDLEQDILLMLTAFLEHGKNVTAAQQEMFSIIPRVFYSTYHCTFGQAFTTVHSFIYYGTSTLVNAPQAIQAIIEMSIANMNVKQYRGRNLSETDNCEGVLVLQSLVLACGSFLTKDIWIVLLQKIVEKLNTPIKNINLIANIIGLLCLCLVQTQNSFTNQENLAILGHVLAGASKCAKAIWGQKVIIAGLAQLMTYLDKDFIKVNFPIILETLLILLEGGTVKLNSIKEAIIDTVEDDQEGFQYDNLIEMTTNNLKKLDQFTFFKQQFTKLHANYKEILMEVIEKLPPIRRDFLNRVLTAEKVENEMRNIFKIKRGPS